MSESAGKSKRRASPGRPRVHDDEMILDTALALMAEIGYQGMSLQDIATRSGISVPSIYRRWSNKAELVSAAVLQSKRDRVHPVGDLRADLLAQLRDVRGMYENVTDIGMTGTLLAEERRHPEFIGAWRRVVVGPRRAAIADIISREQSAGVIGAEIDPYVVAELVVGAYYAARVAGAELNERWDEQIIDTLLAGITPRA